MVEPYELPAPDRIAFWEEAMAAARVLGELLQPAKMNYEIHGNVIPHLHLHLYPRFPNDPYETGALRPHRASFARSKEDLAEMADALKTALLGFRRSRKP